MSIASLAIRDDEYERASEDIDIDELVARDPSFGSIFRKIKKIARPAMSIASLAIRDDAYERDLEDIDIDELIARDPSFGSIFRKIKKIARPAMSIASLAIRDDEYERALEGIDIDELIARDPSLGSIFKKVKNFFSKQNVRKVDNAIHRVEGTAQKVEGAARKVDKITHMFLREEGTDLSERDIEDLEELSERGPSDDEEFYGREFDDMAEELTNREISQLQELAERDPSFFGKIWKKVRKVVNPTNIGKVANVASMVIREDDADLAERDYSDFELDLLD